MSKHTMLILYYKKVLASLSIKASTLYYAKNT